MRFSLPELLPFCFVLLLGTLLPWPARGDEPAPHALELTAAEQAYVAQASPIRMCVDPDWVPFERINERGQHEGIAADLVQLVAQRTGLQIELLPTHSWDESLAASRAGHCQIMSFLNQTPARDVWLLFTAPIFTDPNIIITREEHPFVADLSALDGEIIALPRGTMVEERIRRDYRNLSVQPTGSEEESVALVSARQADLTVRSLIVAAYAIKKEGLFNLKIAGQIPEYGNHLRIGVLKGEPLLRDILDKGVRSISPQEREAISNRHVSIKVQRGIDYGLVWKILAAAGAVLAWVIWWNRKLRALNRELERLSTTDRLTSLFNRMKLDEVFEHERLRAQRFEHPFSVILIDVDHFKQVNDEHGHQTGDQILMELARILQHNTRAVDTVGRWGGEEFLIICPQTREVGALTLAEKLRERIAVHDFPMVRRRTASLGVATYRPGEEIKDLVARADQALYSAKHKGRNRVEVG